jgi:hypothetical protein
MSLEFFQMSRGLDAPKRDPMQKSIKIAHCYSCIRKACTSVRCSIKERERERERRRKKHRKVPKRPGKIPSRNIPSGATSFRPILSMYIVT